MHVIGVQEIRANIFDMVRLRKVVRPFGYRFYWAMGPGQGASAGVGLFICTALLSSRTAVIPGGEEAIMKHHDGGRWISMPLDWGGHKLCICCIYLHNHPEPAAQFLHDVLQRHLGNTHRKLIVVGDFNFVEDPSLDRYRHVGASNLPADAQTPSDRKCMPVIKEFNAVLVDAYRHLHPASRGFTFFSYRGAARLDRVYVARDLLRWTRVAEIGGVTPSDHRLACMHLAPRAAAQKALKGQGVQRVRLYFWASEELQHSFRGWVRTHIALAPHGDDVALLRWWVRFKRALFAQIKRLNRVHADAEHMPDLVRDRMHAVQEVERAYAAVESGEGQMAHVLESRRKWADVIAAIRERNRLGGDAEPDWVHQNERPSPGFTAAIRPPVESRWIGELRAPGGGVVGPGKQQADVMIEHLAAISAQREGDPQVMTDVLNCMEVAGTKCDDSDRLVLGKEEVSVEEILKALKRQKPGKSPGLDGLPMELYRKEKELFAPILSKVFTALGRSGEAPEGFLDGVVSSLYKDGDPADPSNYRPITLLNTDYRILAKVLANRLLPVLGRIISPEQSAFLKGRRIGDNIMLLQMLPYQLELQKVHSAVIAFLDFCKAYDTVQRRFLLAAMTVAGVGAGFLKWTMCLLGDTRASALINGHLSRRLPFRAGVRQGCPLAPLLYLFVGEALLHFLSRFSDLATNSGVLEGGQQQQLGLQLAGVRRVCSQYADDVQVFLANIRLAGTLVSALRMFGAASGQLQNLRKSKLLLIGSQPEQGPQGGEAHGMSVVEEASALGLTFRGGMGVVDPKGGWEPKISAAKEKLGRLSRLPLSRFGRGMGASTYALSPFLFHAEFVGIPPEQDITELQRMLAWLVDRNMQPRAYTWVRRELLVGSPKQGGFGVLPLLEHIRARHAWWAHRLLLRMDNIPWVHMVTQWLRTTWGEGWHTLMACLCTSDMINMAGMGSMWLPYPLQRIFTAWQNVSGGLRDVVGRRQPMEPGAWCRYVPLFGNPWVHRLVGGKPELLHPKEFLLLMQQGVHTLGEAISMHARINSFQGSTREWERAERARMGRELADVPDRTLLHELLTVVLQAVPAAWRQAVLLGGAAAAPGGRRANLGGGQLPGMSLEQGVDGVARYLMCRLGWDSPCHREDTEEEHVQSILAYSVRLGTELQLGEVREERWRRWDSYVREARGIEGGGTVGLPWHQRILDALEDVWGLRWDNRSKEFFWLALLNGLPTAQRYGGPACPCGRPGAECPGRQHHLWDCVVAQAVVEELRWQLGVYWLPCHNIWLMTAPREAAVHPTIWRVVCVCALNAMWHGSRKLQLPPEGCNLGTGGAAVQRASYLAVTKLWDLLVQFARTANPPMDWKVLIGPAHPFLCFPSDGARMAVHRREG